MRKAAARTVHTLRDTIGSLLDVISPNECRNYIAAVGYDLDENEAALA